MRFRSKNRKNIRLASTTGHVILVGEEWVTVPEHMEGDAYANGCISEEMFNTIASMQSPEGQNVPHNPANPANEGDKSIDPASSFNEGDEGLDNDPPTSDEDSKPVVSDHEQAIIAQKLTIRAMINKMVDNPSVSDFTERGTPNLKVLSDRCEFTVTKAAMEPIWTDIQAERDKEEGE